MTTPLGEGVQGDLGIDGLLNVPDPTYQLISPTTAPADMLAGVRVNTLGQCLESDTPLGTIAIEMYWKAGDGTDEEFRGDFYAALSPELDPDAADNPTATQHNPYTILSDGALYQVVVRTPLEAIDTEWSPESTGSVSNSRAGYKLFGGMSLHEFRSDFPGVDVDGLPEGQYTITATERTKPTVAIAARVENGEPLTRFQSVTGNAVHYRETLAAGFGRSALRPDTAVAIIDSRTTIRENGEADRQRLQFTAHDGFQRTGEGAEENSGAVELIVLQGDAIEYTGFTFTPYQPPPLPDFGYGETMKGFGGPAMRGGPVSFSGLSGGETRYRPPETVRVSMMGIRNMRAIAAFRFAMAGNPEMSADEAQA